MLQVQVGDTLFYYLRTDQYPTNPADVFAGKIKMILIDINDRAQRHYYEVAPFYDGDQEGESELVYPEQVVGFASPRQESSRS